MEVMPGGRTTLVSPLQNRNALLPMEVTPAGIVTPVILSHPSNASLPMTVTPAGIEYGPALPAGYCTRLVWDLLKSTPSTLLKLAFEESTDSEINPEQLANARLPRAETPEGMVTPVSEAQP